MDLAQLGIAIDSRQVKDGAGELDKLTAAGKRAEDAVDRLGDQAQQTGKQVKGASAEAADYADKVQRMANNTRLTGTHVDSLGKASSLARTNVHALGNEFGNLAGSLASGNLSAGEAAGSIGRITVASGAAVGVIGALTAGAGVLAAAFLGVKQQADASLDKYIASLGLTKKEMKELGDISVSFGDIAQATFEVLSEKAGTSATEVKKWFSDAFTSVGEFGKFSVAVIIAAFASGYRMVGNVWSKLPALIGEAAIVAANAAIRALEFLINKGVAGINRLIAGANALNPFEKLPSLAEVSLGQIKNKFTGTGKAIAASLSSDFFGVYREVQSTFGAIAERSARIAADPADDLIADRTVKAAKAHKERADAADKEAERLRKLWEERQRLLDQPQDLSKGLLNADGPLDSVDINVDQFTRLPDFAGQLLDQLRAIADQSQVTAQIMQDAFGNVGGVFGNLIANLAEYQLAREDLAQQVAKGNKTQETADKILHTMQVKNTAQAISGFKSLFKEKTAGYKILTAIEMAYAALQVVNTIKSIALDTTKTASSVANSGIRAAADGVAAVAKAIASLPFPLNLAAGAATAAALIAFGVKMFGGGGGGGGSDPGPTAEDLQEQAGTGSILGDAKAKSDSIARSLELVAANTNRDLEYSNAMLKALRNIDFSIAKMAGTIARQIQVSGSLFDTSKLNLGSSGSGGFLGLFGSTKTTELFDLGIKLLPETLASILATGVDGFTYQRTRTIKESNGFLGIGGGTSTDYDTVRGNLPTEVIAAISDVLGSMRDGLLEAADIIGLDGAEAILNAFQVNLGKISFKDMTGQEIEDQLNAIFSKVGDDMAGAIYPALREMQLVGEGLFETFMRVAKEYQAVDIAMQSLGRTFGATGIQSVAMRDHLVQLFGGLEEFMDATDAFANEFLSEAQRIAPVANAVREEMARLGMAGITTREQFRSAVMGLDLTTVAGREMYASLLAVAPAFDKVLDYVEKANEAQIKTLENTVEQFTRFAENLKKYRDTLFQTDQAQGNAYSRLRSQFMATAELAATGDATALGGLENAGRTFLEAARNNASTREQYLRDVALVARGVDQGIFAAEETADYAQLQLDALENAVSILQQISTNTAITAGTAGATIPTPSVVAPTSTPAPVGPTVEEQNETIIGQQAQMLGKLNDLYRLWQRFEGDGLTVKTDPDTPLDVVTP